jgi:hypothetical protein
MRAGIEMVGAKGDLLVPNWESRIHKSLSWRQLRFFGPLSDRQVWTSSLTISEGNFRSIVRANPSVNSRGMAKSKYFVWCRLRGKTAISSPSVGLLGLPDYPALFALACSLTKFSSQLPNHFNRRLNVLVQWFLTDAWCADAITPAQAPSTDLLRKCGSTCESFWMSAPILFPNSQHRTF